MKIINFVKNNYIKNILKVNYIIGYDLRNIFYSLFKFCKYIKNFQKF